MDEPGIEPGTSRMLSERHNQLDHTPVFIENFICVGTTQGCFTCLVMHPGIITAT